ncbi:MAG: hypothetical protein J0H63_14040, partial [Rhizobiales bacterium]|nr:hypothetical protein [Hyphomicrobiales bacterium]
KPILLLAHIPVGLALLPIWPTRFDTGAGVWIRYPSIHINRCDIPCLSLGAMAACRDEETRMGSPGPCP